MTKLVRTICIRTGPTCLAPGQNLSEGSTETFEKYKPYNLNTSFSNTYTLFWNFGIRRAKILPNLNSKQCNSESLKRHFFYVDLLTMI